MVEVYGLDDCYHCLRIKQLLEVFDIDHEYLLISDREVRTKFQYLFPDAVGVPQVMWDGVPISGYDNVAKKVDEHIANTMNYGEGEVQ